MECFSSARRVLQYRRTEGRPGAIAEDLLEYPDRQLSQAVEEFLEEVKLTKEDETWRGYDVALRYFQQSCKKLYAAEIAVFLPKPVDLLFQRQLIRDPGGGICSLKKKHTYRFAPQTEKFGECIE
jgi:hypothetical protein